MTEQHYKKKTKIWLTQKHIVIFWKIKWKHGSHPCGHSGVTKTRKTMKSGEEKDRKTMNTNLTNKGLNISKKTSVFFSFFHSNFFRLQYIALISCWNLKDTWTDRTSDLRIANCLRYEDITVLFKNIRTTKYKQLSSLCFFWNYAGRLLADLYNQEEFNSCGWCNHIQEYFKTFWYNGLKSINAELECKIKKRYE